MPLDRKKVLIRFLVAIRQDHKKDASRACGLLGVFLVACIIPNPAKIEHLVRAFCGGSLNSLGPMWCDADGRQGV
jgi:hypothetical protein